MPTPPPGPQLVHIQQPAPEGSPLSKAQLEFNRLTKRIAKLEQAVHTFRAAATELRQRVQAEYRPLQARHNEARAALVRVLDRAHATYPLTRSERAKIGELLAHACADLPQKGFPELQAVLAKYAPPPPTPAEAAAEHRAEANALKQLFARRYGIEFDPEADLSTPEKLHAYAQQVLAEHRAAYEAEAQAQEARRAQRKKSPKQQAAAEKVQAEAQSISKAVRTLYLDLVKHLHPDREPDEAERDRKTELLKQVTTAYEANELLTLLRLQLELQRIDQTHLENLAEDQLRYYNQLLRDQTRELDQVLLDERQDLASFIGRPASHAPTPAAMRADFEQQKQQLAARTNQLAAEVRAFEQDPAALKAFLKEYKFPK